MIKSPSFVGHSKKTDYFELYKHTMYRDFQALNNEFVVIVIVGSWRAVYTRESQAK